MRRAPGFLNARVLLIVGVAAIGLLWVAFDRESTYNFDAQNKLYQLDSVVKQGFRSENLLYAGEDLDPERRFSPIAYSVRLEDDRHVSAFPVALSVLAAPIYLLFGPAALSAIGLISLIGVWLVHAATRPPLPLLASLMGATFLWLLVFDYNEHVVSAFLGILGLRLLLLSLPATDLERRVLRLSAFPPTNLRGVLLRALAAGIIIGGIVWFRHEGLVFGGALALSLLVLLPGWNGDLRSHAAAERTPLLGTLVAFVAGFSLIVAVWMAWNAFDYGHFLGPRYMVNRGGVLPAAIEILHRYQNLLLVGGAKIGLFVLLPFLPILLVRTLWRFLQNGSPGPQERLLTFSTAIFVFSIPAIVPNDGIAGLGPRFLILAVAPAFLILQLWYSQARPVHRRILHAWLALSVILPVIMFALFRKGAAYQRSMHDRYQLDAADIRIFPTQSLYYYYGADTTNCECYLATGDAALAELLDRLHRFRPGRTIVLVHLRALMEARENVVSRADPALRAQAASLIAASRWNPEGIEKFPGLAGQKRSEFRDLEIWTAHIAGGKR